MIVKYLVPEENLLSSNVAVAGENNEIIETIDVLVSLCLTQMLKLRSVKLTKKDKLAFLEFYAKKQRKQ
jgi:hypothetical protein